MSEFLYRFQIQEFVLFGVCVCGGGGGGLESEGWW